jgi:hypothetical protein
MLAVASAFEPKTNMETLAARARHARRNLHTATASALTRGLGALRATSDAPGVLSLLGARATSDAPGVLSLLGAKDRRSALIKPAESGNGLMSWLSAQTTQVSPLAAGIGGVNSSDSGNPRSLGALQSQMIKSRRGFARIDNQSRYMQATSGFTRGATGFSLRLFPNTVDLIA